ncbi:hypothetical protein HKBW3S42_02156, partial [Candidatus Hakubella thermalkaliphila]
MDSGRKEYLKDIYEKPHRGLTQKDMAQDSQGYLEIVSGKPLDTCQKDSALINTLTLMVILISLLQKGRSFLSEKLTLMVKLRLMALHTLSGENLRGNMLLLLFLLIERDWLLNKKIGSLNLSLFQLRVKLLNLWLHIKRENLN